MDEPQDMMAYVCPMPASSLCRRIVISTRAMYSGARGVESRLC